MSYTMETMKQGESGKSESTQSGEEFVPPDKPISLSRLTLGFHPGDQCRIILKLFKDGAPIAEKILLIPEKSAV